MAQSRSFVFLQNDNRLIFPAPRFVEGVKRRGPDEVDKAPILNREVQTIAAVDAMGVPNYLIPTHGDAEKQVAAIVEETMTAGNILKISPGVDGISPTTEPVVLQR